MIHLVLLFANMLLLVGCIAFMVLSQVALMRSHNDISRLYSITMRRFQTGGEIIAAMDTVPIKKHVTARFLFRDPWALYPQIVRDAVADPKVVEAVPVEVNVGGVVFGPPEDEKPTLQ